VEQQKMQGAADGVLEAGHTNLRNENLICERARRLLSRRLQIFLKKKGARRFANPLRFFKKLI